MTTTPLLTYRDRNGVRVNIEALIASRLLLTANSGGGKSHAIRQLLEETHGKVQHIVIDREGEFGTLRESYPYLLVGPGGELAADLRSAPLLAKKLLELGVNAIVDLSEIALPQQRQYVAAFFNAMSDAPRALWHDVLVVLDEGHLFAPQKFKKGEKYAADSLAAVSLAASIWRKRGFCLAVATQRIAKLDNDVAAELLNKMIGRTSEEDRRRAGDELGMGNEASRGLRHLEPGTFWVYGPAVTTEPLIVRTVKDLKTRPPKRGAAREAAPPTPAAIRAIADALAELPKEAAEEAHTIEGLRARIVQLERLLKAAPKVAGVVAAGAAQHEIEKAVNRARGELLRDANKQLEAFMGRSRRNVALLERLSSRLATEVGQLQLIAQEIGALPVPRLAGEGEGHSAPAPGRSTGTAVSSTGARKTERETPSRAPFTPKRDSSVPPHQSDLPKGERLVLTAIAQHDEGVTREQLTVLTGYKRSTRDAYIQRMSQRGLLELRGDTIVATAEGIAALGDFEPLPTGDALYDYWTTEGRLPDGERRVLVAVAGEYPEAVSREFIDTETGFKRSTRDAYIQRLLARRLVEVRNGGVRMSDNLHG